MIPALAPVAALLGGVPRWVWQVIAAALLAWLAYSWAYGRGAASRDAEVGQWRTAAQAGLAANTTNQNTIRELRKANLEWAERCTFDQTASGKDANTVEANRDALPRDDQRRQEERETMIYDRDQSAAEWARAVVPAAVADRLRK